MKKILTFIVLGVIIIFIMGTGKEFFTDSVNSTSTVVLSVADLENIKKSIDDVANELFIDASKKLGDTNIKILIESFIKTTQSDDSNKKNQFEKNVFVQNILNDEKLSLSENVKQSLYLELYEAHVLNRNLNVVPIRLLATEKITNEENTKKIKEKLFPHLKKINKILILYFLKYYDNTGDSNKSRFDTGIISIEQINKLVERNPKLFS